MTLTQINGWDGNLASYFKKIQSFPMLKSREEEYVLAKRYREHEDPKAADKLVTSHLRLVAKIAICYRGYGLPIGEIVAEGNVGLMQAVRRFEPERGFRLATYAMWWIRASIQEYILSSWSLVKMGTTSSQKKLFFNLRRAKSRISAFEEGDLKPEHVATIARRIGVPQQDVIKMNRRMSRDASLNTPVNLHDEDAMEWQDALIDDSPSPEDICGETLERESRHEALVDSLAMLNTRQRYIFKARHTTEKPPTLAKLSKKFGVSRERIRQIEVLAFEKIQKAVLKNVPA